MLGPRTLITHGLQRLMGCILPTMHCRSQHCWELLHPFAHHCQHARNNSQHCWRNNVGSCCVRLHAAWVFQLMRKNVNYLYNLAILFRFRLSELKIESVFYFVIQVFGFNLRQRKLFLKAVMRYGLPSPEGSRRSQW